MSISFIVTVCDEHEELDILLTKLVNFIQEPNEIIIVFDDKNTTKEVFDIIEKFKNNNSINCYGHELNNDFASHKNFANTMANCDWIFQIDADEIPSDTLLLSLHSILNTNPGAELIFVPRINTVDNITEEHIKKWNWQVNENNWINFPDYQSRIYKNIPEIKWKNKVHERIQGFKTYSSLPAVEEYCLYHHKDIVKQEKQNELYNNIK